MTKRSNTGLAVDDGSEIRQSVLAYLRAHPQAADTLRGIVNWWLPRQRYDHSCQRIEQALDGLVIEGLLHRDRLPGGDILYALNHPMSPTQATRQCRPDGGTAPQTED